MKKLNKISLQDEFLNKEQLRNVTGGSIQCVIYDSSGILNWGSCAFDSLYECFAVCKAENEPLGWMCDCWVQ